MDKLIGVRREDKNIWERRVPLTPDAVKKLREEDGILTVLQPFERRSFPDKLYEEMGATINEDLGKCKVIAAVKEIPVDFFEEDKTYIFFSHTIKGQDYNMPMLKKMMDLKCTLIDYETITDEKNNRLVFFGRFAGLAGMIDALHGLGKRLKHLGHDTPLLKIEQAIEYEDLKEAAEAIKEVAEEIKKKGLPKDYAPYIFGFAGYGNVSRGAQEIFDILPFADVEADELEDVTDTSGKKLYKVVFREEDMVEPENEDDEFELHDYYDHPDKYKSKFEKHLPHLSVLINAVYWDEIYPRLVTKDYLRDHYGVYRLILVADISCDINGSIEFTEKATEIDNPAYTYNPQTGEVVDGYEGKGIVNIAVDNLPAELPVDSSIEFSKAFAPFVKGILNADYSGDFDSTRLPDEIKRAVILYKGELTPKYAYIKDFLG